jgi:hypothetical protein
VIYYVDAIAGVLVNNEARASAIGGGGPCFPVDKDYNNAWTFLLLRVISAHEVIFFLRCDSESRSLRCLGEVTA